MAQAPRNPTSSSRARQALVLLGTCGPLALLGACERAADPVGIHPSEGLSSASRMAVAPAPPVFREDIPLYPAPVLYILYREFVHKNPHLTSFTPDNKQYQNHVERRLRQLYPGKGYPGMTADARRAMSEYLRAWATYERDLRLYGSGTVQSIGDCEFQIVPTEECGGGIGGDDGGSIPPEEPPTGEDPSWDGKEEHPEYPEWYIPTVVEEADSLQALPHEIERLDYYESLADGTYYRFVGDGGGYLEDPGYILVNGRQAFSRDDLIRLAGEGVTPLDEVNTQGLGTALVVAAAAAGVPGYLYWRVWVL
jgi:hypothetical protein